MPYIEINTHQLKERLSSQKDLVLIDVREEYEFEDQNIGGTNIPMREVLSKVEELKDLEEVYLCCKSGKRSLTVAYHLSQKLPNLLIYTLKGGIVEFINEAE